MRILDIVNTDHAALHFLMFRANWINANTEFRNDIICTDGPHLSKVKVEGGTVTTMDTLTTMDTVATMGTAIAMTMTTSMTMRMATSTNIPTDGFACALLNCLANDEALQLH